MFTRWLNKIQHSGAIMDLINKRVVLTGGASGIGAAVLRRLAAEGAQCVHVADQNQAALTELVSELSPHCEIRAATLDVTDREALSNWFNAADAAMGGIDIVINNAGIMSGPIEFPETPIAAMIKVIDVNLIAMMIGTRLAVERMHARGIEGVVMNTASVAAFNAMPADPAYAASKAGIVNFTQSCAPLAQSHGVRVVAICPGVTDTPIVPHDAEWLKPALASVQFLTPDEIVDAMVKVIGETELTASYVRVDNQRL
jgi:NAD(P)-dependent dehydrogenase (short-subunit alcohol dehydrogenase family)